jgi:hypothetical protein
LLQNSSGKNWTQKCYGGYEGTQRVRMKN